MTPWLSSALLRLESVSLWGDCLDADQLTQLFLSLSQTTARDLRLRSLNISGNDLSRLEAGQLARSVARLQEIFLLNTRLTSTQAEMILAEIASSSSPLRGLYLGDNNLASVSPALLARAVGRLRTVSLDDTNLSSEQVTSVLSHIAQCDDTNLRNLDMMGMGVDINLLPLPADVREQLGATFQVLDGCRLQLM